MSGTLILAQEYIEAKKASSALNARIDEISKALKDLEDFAIEVGETKLTLKTNLNKTTLSRKKALDHFVDTGRIKEEELEVFETTSASQTLSISKNTVKVEKENDTVNSNSTF